MIIHYNVNEHFKIIVRMPIVNHKIKKYIYLLFKFIKINIYFNRNIFLF